MKYLKAKFIITDEYGNNIKENMLLQTAKDILCSLAGDAGFESFEESENGITGYVQKESFDKGALDASIGFFPIENIKTSYTIEDAEDKNWNEKWEESGFEPINICDKCLIHDTIHPIPVKKNENILDITIEARLAFGTGTHETTYMIVKELTNMELKGKKVLDCGCGTGILSIAASKLGAQKVTGYDIDEWSVRNTLHNSEINNVRNINAIQGDASVLDCMETEFDVVLANINRNILLADMPAFVKRMAAGATLILSGFYLQDANMLIEKAAGLGLDFEKKDTRNEWCMLKFKAH